jgi:hypothetical protein
LSASSLLLYTPWKRFHPSPNFLKVCTIYMLVVVFIYQLTPILCRHYVAYNIQCTLYVTIFPHNYFQCSLHQESIQSLGLGSPWNTAIAVSSLITGSPGVTKFLLPLYLFISGLPRISHL